MIKKLLNYVGEYKKPSILAPTFIAMEVLVEVTIPFLMASIIDEGLNKNNINHIYFMGLMTFILALISMKFGILAGKNAATASAGFAKNVRGALFEKIQSFSFINIDKFSTAGLITRFTTDINNIQNSYQMILRLFVRAPFMLIFATLMAFYINARLTLIFVGAILFLGGAMIFLIIKVFPIFSEAIKKYDKINENLQENINGIRVVKSYVRENFEIEKFKKSTKDLKEKMLRGEKIIVFDVPLMYMTIYGCIMLLSWFGAKMVIIGDLKTGQLMSLFTYSTNILVSLMMLAMVLVTITLSKPSAERIVEVLDEIPTIKNSESPIYNIENGNIRFENVNFSYLNDEKLLNLENVNIEIKAGETIGIIGGTGSSKSAFVQLIPRLYDVVSGRVLVGGIDVREYDLKTLRDNVAMVLQKNVLFTGTIKENLRWGNKDATDEEIIEAAKLAQADEFIQRFDKKYDTQIERGGTNVSGGQRQRLCIARALLKKPKILILDDSTSAVDTKTDKLIREAFKKHMPNITKIIISQRVSSIKDADKIIVMDDGKIEGFGTHKELLKSNKLYKEVYDSQNEGVSTNE